MANNEWDLSVLAAMKKQDDLQKNTSPIDNTKSVAVADTFHLTPGGKAMQKAQVGQIAQTQAEQYALQEKRRIQALQVQKDAVLGRLKQEQDKINPMFNTGLSNLAGESSRQARNFSEYLAQRGQTQSGMAAQGELQRGADLMTGQGYLEQQRADAFSNIAMRESDAVRDYQLGVTDAGYERQMAELQAKQALDERNRTEGINTVGQYGNDYAREILNIEAEVAKGDNSRAFLIPYLKMARGQKVSAIEEAQAMQVQAEFERWYKEQQLDISRGKLNLDIQKANAAMGSGGSSGRSSGGSSGTAMTFAQALNAWNSGIDTPAIRAKLGLGGSPAGVTPESIVSKGAASSKTGKKSILEHHKNTYSILAANGKSGGKWTGAGTNKAVDYVEGLLSSKQVSIFEAEAILKNLLK